MTAKIATVIYTHCSELSRACCSIPLSASDKACLFSSVRSKLTSSTPKSKFPFPNWTINIPFKTAPNKAAPIVFPKLRINILAAVAEPLLSRGTAPCIVTVNEVLVNPMPIPTKKLASAAHNGPDPPAINTKSVAPRTRDNPPTKETVNVP